ncbi:hypothetical protein N9V90_00100 [Endozoicomonas sp.]|nr:hypothetical protein [Endozoicomonas sp.]
MRNMSDLSMAALLRFVREERPAVEKGKTDEYVESHHIAVLAKHNIRV